MTQSQIDPSPRPATAGATLLEVDDLHVEFRQRSGVVNAVNGVSYTLAERETLNKEDLERIMEPVHKRPPHAAFTGFGKRTPLSEYKPQKRGGQGVLTARIEERRGQLVGALIVGVFRNGLTLVGVESLWQNFAVGILVIVAVSIDQWIRKPA